LARPRGFEPLTLGLEMRGFDGYELHRVVSFCYFTIIILQDVYENGLKTRSPKLRNLSMP